MRRNGEDGCLAQRDVDCFAAGLCFVSLRGDAVLCIRRDVSEVCECLQAEIAARLSFMCCGAEGDQS